VNDCTEENSGLRRAREREMGTNPFETLVETVTGSSAGGLDVPGPLSERVEAELVGDLGGVHCVWQILEKGGDEGTRTGRSRKGGQLSSARHKGEHGRERGIRREV
jgi:hypothetical protein